MKKMEKKIRKLTRKRRATPVSGTLERPRLVFCESNRFIRAQVIDDSKLHTLIYLSTQYLPNNNTFSRKNKENTLQLAEAIANKLKEMGHKKITFDRNGKLYHGKIKLFCDTIRNLGIEF